MELAKIWLATVGLAMAYGVAHDMVTAHVCVEYFTIGHQDLFGTDRPILLALGWGVAATWWVGLVLGGLIAIAAQVGPPPRVGLEQLLRPAVVLLATVALCSIVLGLVGYGLARADVVQLGGMLAIEVPAQSHDRFMANAWGHTAAYGSGATGAVALCGWIVVQRLKSREADVRRLAPHARTA